MWVNYLPEIFPLLSRQKIFTLFLNRFSLMISQFTGRVFLWSMPSQLMIEPASTCNLRCPLCAFGAGNVSRKPVLLSFERYREVIDEVSPYLSQLLLWNQGEPFIHPEFLKMVRYAVDKKVFTLTSTNGHFLKEPEAICQSGLHGIIISLDAASEETYLKYRVGGDFKRVVSGVKALSEHKLRYRYKTPLIFLQMVVTKLNEHETGQFRKLARELGANFIVFKTAEIINPEERALYQSTIKKYQRYRGKQEIPRNKHCKKLWYQPVLLSDGKWGVCCFDKMGRIPVGEQIKKTKRIRDFWFSDEFRTLRKKVYSDRTTIEECRTCSAHLKLTASVEKVIL